MPAGKRGKIRVGPARMYVQECPILESVLSVTKYRLLGVRTEGVGPVNR